MAGGFAASGFAADHRSSSLKQATTRKLFVFENAFGYWPEKTVFQANPSRAFTLD
jgi:hypothetical protein